MPGKRAIQKEKTRRSLIQAAFKQLSANHDFSNLSLREVAREAGIAPTSFYRHFKDLDELGLTMVDEAGLLLRQLMRSARQRIAAEGSVINTSIETFMHFLTTNESEFRILLQARSGTSDQFRAAVSREIMHFIAELSDYICASQQSPHDFAFIQAEAMVKLVFNAGAEVIDMPHEQRAQTAERLNMQLRLIVNGAAVTLKQATSR